MRTLFLIAGLLTTLPVAAEELSRGERDKAMSYLHATRKQVLDLLEPVSQAQWVFKPGPERWSLAECAEHITETENMLRGLVQGTAKTAPVDNAKRAERTATEGKRTETILASINDRSKPVSAPGEIRPAGRFATKAATLAAFRERRDVTIRYVETTTDDLRGRFFSMGPSFENDLYELILIIAGHSERHLKQMKEVMAAPGYPKQ